MPFCSVAASSVTFSVFKFRECWQKKSGAFLFRATPARVSEFVSLLFLGCLYSTLDILVGCNWQAFSKSRAFYQRCCKLCAKKEFNAAFTTNKKIQGTSPSAQPLIWALAAKV
ncbi:hypothetical protein D5R81_19855 [Parashewanella spongiae]|uniref:Uncharacterized protein n=1 Tax=Parashewanella spongiae TaxID=342950 RepID=A0A3A6T228_9GAMM|nr:hypothetical protein [Parashewanella spongiae]MCL1080279.1 hypothetical protein [Parashewanella spongiae]RJY01624.1 hypothetical protein D5R81_19855 [Parashewanella spongiae]